MRAAGRQEPSSTPVAAFPHPMELPEGTVTFLFTDLEGSTRAWEVDPDGMRLAIARHDAVLQEAVESAGGALFKKTGDGICAVFPTAGPAAAAALEACRRLESEGLPAGVRFALYSGAATPSGGDYVGPTLNRASRVLGVGHGGQILVSESAADLARGSMPPEASLKDLGLHRIRDLERPERIYQLLHPSLRAAFPPLRSLSAFAHNLPIQLTRLIGREQETRDVAELLEANRLVTLTGSGGCGKTRLALHAASAVLERFRDGVWFVDLSAVREPALVMEAAAAVLGVREAPGIQLAATLREYLRPRALLLILDNCEHLLEACAVLTRELLQECAELRILATSREHLGVQGEVLWRVPSLSLPASDEDDSNSEALQLFVDRASIADPRFRMRTEERPHVRAICRRLDGIPLAIELAAARVTAFPVAEIAARLNRRFLRSSSRTALPRHQTLRAVMDWSYELLAESERALLRRLSVFAGGFTLEAVEAVAADNRSGTEPFDIEDAPDLLSRLVEKSLVLRDDSPDGVRYRLLQMVREYAEEQLPEDEMTPLRDRHLSCFLAMAEEFEANITGPRQEEWLRAIDTELDNMRAALEWCKLRAPHVESGLLLAGALTRFWHIRGLYSEGRRNLEALLALAPDSASPLACALGHNGAGILAWAQNDLPAARAHYGAAIPLWEQSGEDRRCAATVSNLGLIAIEEQRFEEAEALLQASLEAHRESANLHGQATSLNNLGLVAFWRDDQERAEQLFLEAKELRTRIGDSEGLASVLNNLGTVAVARNEHQAARQYIRESLTAYRRLGDVSGTACCLLNLSELEFHLQEYPLARDLAEEAARVAAPLEESWWGHAALLIRRADIALVEGAAEEAETLYLEAIALSTRYRLVYQLPDCFQGVGMTLTLRKRFADAVAIFSAASAARERSPHPGAKWEHPLSERLADECRLALGEEDYAAAWQRGQEAPLETLLRSLPAVASRSREDSKTARGK